MKVINIDKDKSKSIYIGRGSPLGNPYEIGRNGSREEVIAKYKSYLDNEIKRKNPLIISALSTLNENSVLGCHCAPAQCHGDVIIERVKQSFKPLPKGLSYAGIGARKTPDNVQSYMSKLATRLDDLGFILRSGSAGGADEAFEKGAVRKEIFLPWKGFNKNRSQLFDVSTEALKLAEQLHPAFNRLSQGAQKLMARNGYQLLGCNLREPSQFVVCWTPDGCESGERRSGKTGGTGQAIDLASRYDIPVFNLNNPNAIDRLKILVEELVPGPIMAP